jgi:hypothetical protein
MAAVSLKVVEDAWGVPVPYSPLGVVRALHPYMHCGLFVFMLADPMVELHGVSEAPTSVAWM